MQTTVELQNAVSYWPIWIILAFVLIAALIFLQVFYRIRLREALHGPKPPKVVPPPPRDIPKIKAKYMRRLNALEGRFQAGKIGTRDLYIQLSNLIRMFTYEATGIKVQKYTLNEIRALNMPVLTNLVQDYYEPEFARSANPNCEKSLQKTRRMIQTWF
ncbi:MAG: hypothetical protein K6G07_03140 [Lachnospiraceae bacterium]|nr:hypothetical protein [Lachnospiraceae bacterium]